MSARRRKSAARPRAAAPARSAKRASASTLTRYGWPLAVLLLLAAAMTMMFNARRAAQHAQPEAQRMDPVAAYQHAIQLSLKSRWRESLPYYRRGLEGAPGHEWRPHFNYGIVLNDITLQFETRAGQQVPATHSSAERVVLANASMEELRRAIQLAPDGATRARILSMRANTLVLWGFPWEAFASFRAAEGADSTRAELRDRADQFMALMQDPTRFRFVQPDSATRLTMQ